MYLSFYGLKIKPFQNNTNPDFFWLGEKQKEALAIYKYAMSKMPGILLLTGDVGTGKTTLSNVFLNSLGDQFIVVKVPDPDLEEIDFMTHIADALDFKKKYSSKESFFDHFSNFLDTSSTLGKKVILVIDECQRLGSHLLEEMIKLANIEKDATKLLKVLLIGQSEFNDLLQKNASRALHQLIAINYAIVPLELHETGEFIRHRLKIAGAKRDIFSPDAISKIHEFSAGIPRRINIICDLALLYGFGQELKTINGKLIRECAEDLRPLGFVNTLENNPSQIDVGGDSKKIRKRSPESKLKDGPPWPGKSFGVVILIMIPVFLITYFTNLRTFFKDPSSVETQNLTQTSESAIQEVSKEETDIGKIPTIPKLPTITITKEDLESTPSVSKPAEENISATGEQHQEGIPVDSVLENTDRPGRTGDLSAIDPMDPAYVKENLSSIQILPLAADQQNISQDQAIKKEVQRPDIAPAEKEITEAPEPYDIQALKQNKTQSKELLEEKNETNGEVTNDKMTKKESQDALPNNGRKSSKAGGTQDDVTEPPENIDPGAVIDWVLKNRSK